MLQKRLVFEWWAIFTFACILAFFAAQSQWTQRFDNLLLDQATPYAAAPPSDQILIVEIDERSLADFGSWPWKRSIHAQLIEKLSKAGPKVIAYDVLFVEPADANDDRLLADAIASAGNVVLPFQFQIPGSNGREMDQLLPIEPLPSVAAGLGHVGLQFDADGLVRRVDLKGQSQDIPFAHLMEVAKSHNTLNPRLLKSGAQLLPLHHRSSYRTIPASAILLDQVQANFIKNKYVLVGASAQGMADIFPVAASAGSIMPGIEIQANLLNGLLADRFIQEANPNVTLVIAFAAIFILMAAFWRLNPRANLLLSLIVLSAILGGAALLAVFGRYWIAPGPALLGILLLYPLWGWRRLAALNDFISTQTVRLTDFDQQNSHSTSDKGLDAVARQAMRLRSVIGELAGRQDFMAGVISAAPDAMCVVDDNHKILLANKAAEKLFNETLCGKSFLEIMAFEGGYLPIDGSEWSSKTGKVMLVTKSSMRPLYEEGAGTIYCLSDITAIREAERERKEMMEFLSHDMRSPQAAIVSLVDGKELTASSDTLSRIRRHAIQTLKLTEDFVQLARLEFVQLRTEEQNIVELLREAIDENYAQAKANSICITCSQVEDFQYIKADGSALVRALSNLISNAIKYAPKGSKVTCRIWSEMTKDQSTARVYCEIIDEGPGLPEQRLSDPFGRFGYRDETQAVGAGLGLAFVKRAVDLNKGKIECHSSAGEGTRFILSFEAVKDEE